jgi:hypothetical protein
MNLLKTLHENKDDSPYRAFMPPLVGTRQEVDALADYLHNLVSGGGASAEKKTATAAAPGNAVTAVSKAAK